MCWYPSKEKTQNNKPQIYVIWGDRQENSYKHGILEALKHKAETKIALVKFVLLGTSKFLIINN